MAVEDINLKVARLVSERAKREGVVGRIPFEWFREERHKIYHGEYPEDFTPFHSKENQNE